MEVEWATGMRLQLHRGEERFFSLPIPLKQDLRPYEYHHILAADVHRGWFIRD